jgi:hypothetical protein
MSPPRMSRRATMIGAGSLATVPITALAQRSAQPATRFDALANPPLIEGRPSPEAVRTLTDELLFQRASQTYLWALPVLNMMGMRLGSEGAFGAGYNVLPIWKDRLSARTLITTPNSDVIYAMGYADLGKEGPLVVEVPPRLQGILDDFWQRPIPGPTIDGHAFAGDVGFAGPDKGEGGHYLLLPPGYSGEVPEGHFVYRSATNNIFIFWRGFYESPTDLAPPVRLMEQTIVYPLGRRDAATPMQFPNASPRAVNMLPPSDGRAFDALKAFVDSEPVDVVGSEWRGMMAAIGIVKGRPFAPDARIRTILDRAARSAYQTSRVLGMAPEINGLSYLTYPDRQWMEPIGVPGLDLEWNDVAGGYLALDSRVNYFTNAYALSPAMMSRTAGQGAKYLGTWRDTTGQFLSGGSRYRLRLPPNIPAANFWSITLYDAANSSGLDNGQPFPSFGSRDQPVRNPDGSTDIYFGPTAVSGQRSWLRTVPGKGYMALLRLYSPTEAALTRSWKPGDLEKQR